MIRAIAAIDLKKGLATDKGIPWHLPSDIAYFRRKTKGYKILMGYNMYTELEKPLPDRQNFVLTHDDEPLRPGFWPIRDLEKFFKDNEDQDIWIVGGAKVFALTLDRTIELYLTRIEGDFNCTKFFPEFIADFNLKSKSEAQNENDLRFSFEIWQRKKPAYSIKK
jgi:dihydrofolate reductase